MTTDQIIAELGIEKTDDIFKARMIARIMAAADLRFARVIDDVMTDEDQREFERFSDGKGPQEVASWVESKYEGAGEVYEGIIRFVVAELKQSSELK